MGKEKKSGGSNDNIANSYARLKWILQAKCTFYRYVGLPKVLQNEVVWAFTNKSV